jgi:hypothetical protein
VGPRTGLDDVEKILDHTGTQSPTPRPPSPQPVAIPTALSRFHIISMDGVNVKLVGRKAKSTCLIFRCKVAHVKKFVTVSWFYQMNKPGRGAGF